MSLPERDWKYLRSVQQELLAELCSRINKKAIDILNDPEFENDHLRYLALYKHIEFSDEIVAKCFNDWRRSTISIKIRLLHQYKLFTDEHITKLSEEARQILSDR